MEKTPFVTWRLFAYKFCRPGLMQKIHISTSISCLTYQAAHTRHLHITMPYTSCSSFSPGWAGGRRPLLNIRIRNGCWQQEGQLWMAYQPVLTNRNLQLMSIIIYIARGKLYRIGSNVMRRTIREVKFKSLSIWIGVYVMTIWRLYNLG